MKNKLELHRYITTPLGALEITLNISDEIKPWYQSIVFKSESEILDCVNESEHELLDLAQNQLQQYFDGKRTEFGDLLKHQSNLGTHFQKQCWSALCEIPYGETWSYGRQAKHMNNPKAVRAVGAANGKNPLAIVVPCHRVIGANGTLTGYAGGLDKKQWLLAFENQKNQPDLSL
ncbi:methylated-DNA--[protein]-cysteine S-methyltransferase [uncultured Psychrosphaera sp.]|uniref:methylated-DNA--[protein]-cysteine S-methyltransferase n=1 Tax=uncultured Psychrosphaera sp. TaxID=1403522 RepID=UPI0030F5EC98